jgi:formate dehydrogenase major subunit
MQITRRGFFAVGGTLLFPSMARLYGAESPPLKKPLKIRYAKESSTICCYCGVGCGLIVSAENGRVINTEGDPDHPINEGSLCSKGAALYQVANNDRRLQRVLHRAPGSDHFEEKTWDWALREITARVKATRDATFQVKDEAGRLVNRTEGIACLGGASLDNEECYLLSKSMRALGVTYLEHQARI